MRIVYNEEMWLRAQRKRDNVYRVRAGGKPLKRKKWQRINDADAVVDAMVILEGQTASDFKEACDWAWYNEYNRETDAPVVFKECKRWETDKHKEWSASVKWRCGEKCRICEGRRNLVAHHLDGWDKHIEKRFNVKNGVALCHGCHVRFHDKYGYGDNTKEQFAEWEAEQRR